MQPAWRIYYDDGSTFDSIQGSPMDAPFFGFVCAVGYDHENKRYIMNGWDHYCYENGQWWGCDAIGWLDRSIRGKMFAHKIGRTVLTSVYSEIIDRAHRDKDFPLR